MIRNALALFSFIFLFYFSFNFLDLKSADASTIQNEKLIERFSKDYTNKFCNSVAFGLSKESAMNFAYNENIQIFKNKKGIEGINKDFIANKIAFSVIDECGYIVNLQADDGISEFEEKYLAIANSMNKEKQYSD